MLFTYDLDEQVHAKEIDTEFYNNKFTDLLLKSREKFITNKYSEIKLARKSTGDVVPSIHYVSTLDTIRRLYDESCVNDMLDRNDTKHIYKLETDLPQDADTYHAGYIDYLIQAWQHDLGIEIAPWHLYYIYLWQYVTVIMDQPSIYKDLISSDDNQILINDGCLDLKMMIEKLYEKSKFFEALVPQFDNPPTNYQESIYGLLGHISKEYYNVSILSCSIPRVEVLGNQSDWNHLYEMADKVYQEFESYLPDIHKNHFQTCLEYFSTAKEKFTQKSFWENFFEIKRCGSGSQQEIDGDVKKILLPKVYLLTTIPTYISEVPYKLDGKECINLSGLFYSKIVNGILKPHYCQSNGQVQLHIINNPPESPMTKFLGWMKRFHSAPEEIHNEMSESAYDNYFKRYQVYVGTNEIENVLKEVVDDIANNLRKPVEEIESNLGNYINMPKLIEDIERSNKFKSQFEGNIVNYIQYKTDERINKVKKEGLFWFQDDLFENPHQNLLGHKKINLDRWMYYKPKLEPLIDLIKQNPEVLTQFEEKTGCTLEFLWKQHFIYCYSPELYDLFVKITHFDFESSLMDVMQLTKDKINYIVRLNILGFFLNDGNQEGLHSVISICKKLIKENIPKDPLFMPKFSYDRDIESIKQEQCDRSTRTNDFEFNIGSDFALLRKELDRREEELREKYQNAPCGTTLKFNKDFLFDIFEKYFFCGKHKFLLQLNLRYLEYVKLLVDVVHNIKTMKKEIMTEKDFNEIAEYIRDATEEINGQDTSEYYSGRPQIESIRVIPNLRSTLNEIHQNMENIVNGIFDYSYTNQLNRFFKEKDIPLTFIPYDFVNYVSHRFKNKYNPNGEGKHNYDYEKFIERIKTIFYAENNETCEYDYENSHNDFEIKMKQWDNDFQLDNDFQPESEHTDSDVQSENLDNNY